MHDDDTHEGLAHDLRVLARRRDRRQILRLFAGASLVPIFGCGAGSSSQNGGATNPDSGASSAGDSGTTTTPGSCGVIPEETGGPYPGDGTNGPNTLTSSGIVRSDIRSSFGAMSGIADGVPLTIKLQLVNTKANCAALAGYAVYLWHCDQEGNYSLYTAATQNYLRGVQETAADGTVTFTSIFPGCYSGRWPHVHFEIFQSLAQAAATTGKVKTSQLALPQDVCSVVYATTGYEASVGNLAQTSLAKDNVFSDGTSLQLALVTGNETDGYVATLVVGVAV